MNIYYRTRENGKIQAIINYKLNGKWEQESRGGFDRKKDAQKWATERMPELIEMQRQNSINSDLILPEVFDIYINHLERTKKSDNTINTYKMAKKIISDLKIPISDITPYIIQDYFLNLQEEKNCNYSNYFSKTKTVLNYAKNVMQIIVTNPCDGFKLPRVKEDERIKFINKELYQKILSEFKNEKENLLVRTLYETGLRVSEALGINTFNVKNLILKVDRQRLKSGISYELKTQNSYRELPISSKLYNDLKKSTTDINGYIFFGIEQDAFRKRLRPFNVSPHCFRHTRTTVLISEGIDPTVVASIIGDNIETILQVYTELNEDNISKNFEKIRKIL